MLLVGRNDIQRQILQALDAARSGDGLAVALHGEPGAGKTVLLDFAASHASDMCLLRTRGVERESSFSYAALAEVLRPILTMRTLLPTQQSAALSAALQIGPPVDADRFAVCAGTVSLISAAARVGPVLLIVDDAQWVDAASAEVLMFLARRVAVTATCVLFAYRDDPALAGPPDWLVPISVPGLAPAAAARLLAAEGVAVDARLLDWLIHETGGNPLALTDLPRLLTAEEIDERAHTGRPVPLGRALEQSYARLVRSFPGVVQQVLLIVALLDGHGTRTLFGVLRDAHLDVADLGPAIDAGLVRLTDDGSVHLRHPLVRSAVLQSATPSARRAAHLMVAAGLVGATHPELLGARAWHLADAAIGWDAAAADLLEDTARAALERNGHHSAALAFERSAELTQDPQLCQTRMLAAANAYFVVGRTARCVALLDRIDVVSVDAMRLRGRVEMWTGAPLQGGERLVAVAERVASADPMTAVTLMLDGSAGIAMSGRLERAQAVTEGIRALGDRLGPPVKQLAEASVATIMALRGLGMDEEARLDRARAALPTDNPGPLLELLIYFGAAFLFLDRLDTAREMFATYVRIGQDTGALAGLSFALSAMSVADFRAGHWDTAFGAGLESVRLAEDTGRRTDLPNCLVTLSLVEAARGSADARGHAQQAVDLSAAMDLRVVQAQARSVLGLLDLGLGNIDDAVAQLEACGAIAKATGTGQVCNLQWAPELVEALVRSGHARSAQPTVNYMNERAAALEAPFVAAAAARCRGMVASGHTYATEFEDALKYHNRGSQRPFETARTQLAYGERLRRDRRRKEAQRRLRAAHEVFARLAADPWTKRASAELRAAGVEVSPSAPDDLIMLTAQERRIADAVAAGASNREVATRLFLSEKTVEFHLSNVYRKLQLKARTDLQDKLKVPR